MDELNLLEINFVVRLERGVSCSVPIKNAPCRPRSASVRGGRRGGSLPTADEPTATRSEREGRWANRCYGVAGTGIMRVCSYVGTYHHTRSNRHRLALLLMK